MKTVLQIRIDAELKAKYLERCAAAGVTVTDDLLKHISAFVITDGETVITKQPVVITEKAKSVITKSVDQSLEARLSIARQAMADAENGRTQPKQAEPEPTYLLPGQQKAAIIPN